MKRTIKILILSIALSINTYLSSFAGAWTHMSYDSGKEYSSLWWYIKDDGEYAKDEWISVDGVWYWFDSEGILPSHAGFAKDGSLYDSLGIYVDMNDHRSFITEELYKQIDTRMTYEQITSILGKEHEVISSSQSFDGSKTYSYLTLVWYAQNPRSYVTIGFTNSVLSYRSAYWN